MANITDTTGSVVATQAVQGPGNFSLNFVPASTTATFALTAVAPGTINLANPGYKTLIYVPGTVTKTLCNNEKDKYRFGFNGKEKDNEWAGMGNHLDFGARGLDTRIGRWITKDELFKKYPAFAPYVAMGNNPILFMDPNGKDLHIGGNQALSLQDIQSLVPKEYASQIQVVGDKIIFKDYNKLPPEIQNYKGVTLLNNMITSSKQYKYSVSDDVIAVSRKDNKKYDVDLKVENMKPPQTPIPQNSILNISKTPNSKYPLDDIANFLPNDNYDGSVTIRNGSFGRKNSLTGTGDFPIERNTIVFHELDENYERTEHGKDYDQAHKAANKDGAKFSKEENGKSDPNAGNADTFTPASTDTK